MGREKILTIFLLLGLLTVSPLYAYTFGKNKFQTRDYPFQIYESTHFRLFSYTKDPFIIKFSLSVLEEAVQEYSQVFGFELGSKVPVILYNSPKHFSETNVITDVIEEGIGGFTEIFKNRIVVPFTGSYSDLRHVLRHELVHAYQYTLMRKKKTTIEEMFTLRIPLWCVEGLAEYLSIGWTPDGVRYVRDLIISDKLPSVMDLNYLGGYIVYKLGQLIYKFIDDTYGREKIGEFFFLLVYSNSIEKAVKRAFGLSLEDFNAKLKEYIRQNFYTQLGLTSTPVDLKRYSNHEKLRNFYNVAPVLTKDGSTLYYIQEKMGNFYIVKYSAISGEKLATIFKSSKMPNFENIHILRPSLSLSDDGRFLVFSAQTGEGDVIYILDNKRNRILRTLKFDVDAVYTPSISPDGKIIAFSGLKEGFSEIYIYYWRKNELLRVTEDAFDDRDPTFTPSGDLIFVSDRNEESEGGKFYYGSYAVFALNLETKEIKKLTPYFQELQAPLISDDSTLLFIARDNLSSLNVFRENLKTGEIRKITNFATEVKWFSVSKTGKIVASILNRGGYDVFEVRSADSLDEKSPEGEFLSYYDTLTTTTKPYSTRFTLDWIYGTASYSSIYGFSGSTSFGISDELGDHLIQFTTDLTSDILNSNFEFDYWNLKKRIDYGISIYQYWDAGYISFDTLLVSRTRGIFLQQSIPYSRSRRTELGLSLEAIDNYYLWETPYGDLVELPDFSESRILTGLYLAHVFDNVYYNYIQDPISGTRYYAGFFKSVPFDLDLNLAVLDFRYYYAFSENYIWANRLKIFYSYGKDRYFFTFNGFDDLRGVYYGDQIGDKYFLFNSEFRFPFIKKLSLGFPLPLDITGIDGVLFLDAGLCTAKNLKDIVLFDLFPRLKDPVADIGYGLRLWLGFTKLKIDFAHPTNFQSVNPKPLIKISFGFDF